MKNKQNKHGEKCFDEWRCSTRFGFD